MEEEAETAVETPISPQPQQRSLEEEDDDEKQINTPNEKNNNHSSNSHYSVRKERLQRACTARSASRLYPTATPAVDKKAIAQAKKERIEQQQEQRECSKIITPLVNSPSPSQIPRWNLRSMWELASLLNFLHVFRPLLNITIEITAEELETALIMSSSALDDIHIPLLKAIPPVTRMAMGRATWVTALCRKLRDWWHWVADGELPIVASQGAEIEAYKMLDPATRVVILKALCDIRVEQEDIRNYIDDSVKRGIHLSVFRKERIGGDSRGTSYWYEDDPVIGHRLYREVRKIEVKKVKATKGRFQSIPTVHCQWETVATNFDEFVDVSEKLFSSKNRTEIAVGKKLKNDMLPEIEKIHKRKERLLKKQQREAILLDNCVGADGLGPGRALRDRKPVTYTFDDFDRSINEAIKVTKRKQPSPEPVVKKESVAKPEPSTNGRSNGPSSTPRHASYDETSPISTDYDENDEDNQSGPLDRGNRRRQRPQRYSAREFVEAVSDNEDFDSDDDIVGEAIYDEEYLRSRKQRKVSSSSEGDEEYHWDEENVDDEEEEEEEESPSSTDSEEPNRPRKSQNRNSSRNRTRKLRSVDELQSGLRRSRRSTRNRINYRQIEMSESEADSAKLEKSIPEVHSDASNSEEYSNGIQHSQEGENKDEQETKVDQPVEAFDEMNIDQQQQQPVQDYKDPTPAFQETHAAVLEIDGVGKRRFLDLNELAPGTGFDDSPKAFMRDEDKYF
ncbi:DDT domain-containing protein DDR4-like [Papaver somniferum]|uniref:DDT domain-containing protein DDR4-like n=1 Tax=Papaver somniferum TaxID=3469 RepID=UPI000E6F550D|nr:DDT domain-containing protein DDR4-like [Papaver somniferum]